MTTTTRSKRNFVRGAAALALAALTAGAVAQEYPARPIRLLIPFPPGGGTDFVSRVVGHQPGRNAEVAGGAENRPGASGNMAIAQAAQVAPDGYTIVMGQSDNMALGPYLYANVGYDTLQELRADHPGVGDAAGDRERGAAAAGEAG